MIEPNMATLLTYVMTDALIDYKALNTVFHQAINSTFNSISVDGCMSTNDMAIILANGLAGNNPLEKVQARLQLFRDMLTDVLMELCQAVVRDGEGATKFIAITVKGAKSKSDARCAAYAIANSNLIKTAIFGEDPNWGRVIAALGASGIPIEKEKVSLNMGNLLVFYQNSPASVNMNKLKDVFKKDRIDIEIDLGAAINLIMYMLPTCPTIMSKSNAEYST